MEIFEAIIQGILLDVVNPLVFLPALAIGWWAPRAQMVLIGAVVLTIVQIGLSLMQPLPEGSELVWWLMPTALVAPLVLAWGAFRVRAWLRASDAAGTGGRGGPRLLRMATGIMLGGALGAGLVVGVGLLVIELGDLHDREGGEAYLLFFGVAPIGLLVGMIIGGVIGWKRAGRKARTHSVPSS